MTSHIRRAAMLAALAVGAAGAAQAQETAPSPECAAIKAEQAAAVKQLQADSAQMTQMAMSTAEAVKKSSMAMNGASVLSSVAGLALPGVGSMIGSGISMAAQAAQTSQVNAFPGKMAEVNERQVAVGERIQELAKAYEAKCAAAEK